MFSFLRSTRLTKICVECQRMLDSALYISTKTGFDPPRRVLGTVDVIQKSARDCAMCALLWLILRGSDNTTIEQILRYNDPTFNKVSIYDSDGGTDIDELLGEGTKVTVSVSACVRYRMDVHQLGEQVLETASIYDDLPASILSLLFKIKYRTDVSRKKGRKSTIVEEDLIIFRQKALKGNIKPAFPLMLDTRLQSDHKFALLNKWVQEDMTCRQVYSQSTFPLRVLDLTTEGRVKIIDMQGLASSSDSTKTREIKYAALSHRWGASRHLITTKSTLSMMRGGIRVNKLPLTFRDAVTVCRRLDVNYLWIDALCIVQDDAEEWRKESIKMGDIFQNARFTIAAHCAPDDSEGFLSKALIRQNAVACSLLGIDIGLMRRGDVEVDVTQSPLSKRGWVLQERFMSSHTLHFNLGRLYSETQNAVVSENGRMISAMTGTATTIFSPSALPRLRNLLLSESDQVDGTASTADIPSTPTDWLDIVEMYTNCDLTREEDKLVAISGLARKLFLRTRNDWCAGIWSDQLSQGLLWLAQNEGLSRPTVKRAPSWSWAAWDGPVQYPLSIRSERFIPRSHIVSVTRSATHESLQANGHGIWLDKPGSLTIRARVVRLPAARIKPAVQLGPGPPRMGFLTNDNIDLPRLELKHFVSVHSVELRKNGFDPHKERVQNSVRTHDLVGWISVDNPNSSPVFGSDTSTSSHDTESDLSFAILGTYQAPIQYKLKVMFDEDAVTAQGTMYLGIFLCKMHNDSSTPYYRVGMGQLSHTFVTGHISGAQPGRDQFDVPRNFFDDGELSTVNII